MIHISGRSEGFLQAMPRWPVVQTTKKRHPTGYISTFGFQPSEQNIKSENRGHVKHAPNF